MTIESMLPPVTPKNRRGSPSASKSAVPCQSGWAMMPTRRPCASRTRPVSYTHLQRIVAVAARREAHDVVGQGDVGKRMLAVEPRQSHGGLAGRIDAPHIAQYLVVAAGVGEHRRHVGIELRQSLHEFVDAALFEILGHESFDLYIGHFQGQPHFAPEDDELAGDIHSRQIITGIRFSVALLPGRADDR